MAVVLALALHEALSGLVHGNLSRDEVERVQVSQIMRITIRAKPTPRPTPKPTPRPTPPPKIIATPQHVAIVNPAPAAPKRARLRQGAAKAIAHTIHHSHVTERIAIPHVRGRGAGLGRTGSGVGGGSTGTRGSGAGGAGNGTGSGGRGNGNGGYATADEPCGFVEFVNIQTPRSVNGGFYQNIRMMVHYGNGQTQGYELDYPFYYPNEAAFPWSDQNIHNVDFPVPFQFPPADKAASEPPVLQYVMRHSTRSGITTLKDCKGM